MNDIGCLIEYKTNASSTSWWTGVWGTNTNGFKLWFNYQGLSLKPTGDATTSGNLDVGSGVSSKINAHTANNGYTGYAELHCIAVRHDCVNLQTTRVNGGWMYFKINNDNFLLLSGSGQFVTR